MDCKEAAANFLTLLRQEVERFNTSEVNVNA
jgi:hypothetical protein